MGVLTDAVTVLAEYLMVPSSSSTKNGNFLRYLFLLLLLTASLFTAMQGNTTNPVIGTCITIVNAQIYSIIKQQNHQRVRLQLVLKQVAVISQNLNSLFQ